MTTARLHVRRTGYALGAEVTGIDLTRQLDDATVVELRRAWLDHLLLTFPNQNLDENQLAAFTSRFGKPYHYPLPRNQSKNPNVMVMSNKPVDGKPWDGYKEGQSWHSDGSVTDRPPTGTFLLSKEIPEVGGDTLFANQYMAYEALSPTMRSVVDGLSAIHDTLLAKGSSKRSPELKDGFRETYPPIVHPVVKVHPETQRRALYVGQRVSGFEGMTEEESRPLLDFLNEHAVRYEFTYRHRWQVNELIMWDNRCLMHYAVSDYDLYRDPRHMIRCSLEGINEGHVLAREAVASSG